MDYLPLRINRELRRLGIEEERLPALAFRGAASPADILRWLRSLPTDLGHDELMRRGQLGADAGGPDSAIGRELPVADQGYTDPDTDELLALMLEFDRVVPARRQDGFGFDFPHGRSAALAALRRLPTGAGAAAAEAALHARPGHSEH